MKILVAGASGVTGSLVVKELLNRGEKVCAIVRTIDKFPEHVIKNKNFSYIKKSILDISVQEMSNYVKHCDAFISCLGHNITLKGIFGPPFKLVTNSLKLVVDAIIKNNNDKLTKVVLMNTTGNRNRDLKEKLSIGEYIVSGLISLLVPPQRDNVAAAEFLRKRVGQDNKVIQWVAIRPDSLIDFEQVTDYDILPSPIRSAIFDPGKASRINVAHFMCELLTNSDKWHKWKGQMPVLYNKV